ncbi:MAG: ribonuclease J [Solobacterium sp.]|nr:ribonuclease J [Solobacterium sp.]
MKINEDSRQRSRPVHHTRITDIDFSRKTINRKTDTLVYAMGGLGEVGKNMYCFEHDDEIIIIDCGVLFPGESLPGVDYVIPDWSYLVKNQAKIKAMIITHGHEDHIGAIPFFLQSIHLKEIYAPRFAKALLEKKLEEHRLLRNCRILTIDEASHIQTKYFDVGFYNTIHSFPDSLGVFVNTPNGRAVETGDYKFDFTPIGEKSDFQKMAYMGQIGVTLLMSDSTNSGVPGFSISERKVAATLLEQMRKTPGRLLVSTFASNVMRLNQILEGAVSCNRKVAIFGRSMENVVEIARKNGVIRIPDDSFITGNELNTLPPNRICIVCTGSQGEPMAALSRIANGTHRFLKIIPGDTVIFSSNPIPGNATSVGSVVNKLTRIGANVIVNSPLTSLHTTGHAPQEEQKLMLNLIEPKYFMPIHGEYKMLVQHAYTAQVCGIDPERCLICSNGDIVVMRDGECFIANERIQTDAVYVDGNDASGLSTLVVKDRQILANSGMVAVIVTIDSRYNRILCRPSIVSRGFVYIKDNQTLLKEAEVLLYDALKTKMQQRITFNDIKNTIRGSLEPFLYQKTKRNPIVIPVILNQKAAMEELQNKQMHRA